MPKSFNNALFSALMYISFNTGTSLDDVLRVLDQSSDESRIARLNHNCRISGIPFCWSYCTSYCADGTETRNKVLSFPMTKISTGWKFILDIEENGRLYLSEGKGTRRTILRLSRLNDFSPSTCNAIRKTIAYLCDSNSEKVGAEDLFYFYKQTVDPEVETAYSVAKGDVQPTSIYRALQIEGIPETRHLQYWSGYENPNPHDEVLADQPKKHVVMVKWHNNLNIWYADFVFEDEAWGFSCMSDAGSFPIFDKSFKLDDVDEDTGMPDPEWIGNKMSLKLRSELENAVKSVASQGDDAKSGSWIVVSGKDCYRRWSEIPERDRIHIYIAPSGDPEYFDDIEELDFSPEGEKCLFKNWHIKEEEALID